MPEGRATLRPDGPGERRDRKAAMSTPTLTDSGLETWLVFHRRTDLPDFAAFPLLDDPAGRGLLAEYFRDHLRIAAMAGTGVVLETPTWRANADWGARLGYDAAALDRVNSDAVTFLRDLADEHPEVAVVVAATLGRGAMATARTSSSRPRLLSGTTGRRSSRSRPRESTESPC
jgi:hypothetical protein